MIFTNVPTELDEDEKELEIDRELEKSSSLELKLLFRGLDEQSTSLAANSSTYDTPSVDDDDDDGAELLQDPLPQDPEENERDALKIPANMVRQGLLFTLIAKFEAGKAKEEQSKADGDRWLCQLCKRHTYDPTLAEKDWTSQQKLVRHE